MLSRILLSLTHRFPNAQHITELQTLRTLAAFQTRSVSHTNLSKNTNSSLLLPEKKSLNYRNIILRCVTSEAGETSIKEHENSMVLSHAGIVKNIPYTWLRDHCRCSYCYNQETQQKNINHKLKAELGTSKIELQDNGNKLKIHWEDKHETEYDTKWLIDNTYSTESKRKTPLYLWNSEGIHREAMPSVQYDVYRDTEEGITKTMFNLLKYGFSVIEGVPTSLHDTEVTCERLNFIEETLFGKMWSFTSNHERGDTAYTNMELGAHNDTCYYTAPAGIQAFHCLWHDGTGGESQLVDGFYVAEKLRQEDPAAFKNLTKQIVPHEYVEEGYHVRSLGTVLKVNPSSQEMEHIRFNPYDMAPLDTIAPDEVDQFYKDYKKLLKMTRDPYNTFLFKLHPGMLLLINNWRVLHGRNSFKGKRVLCGCYISHDDWMSKARLAGLV